jgi:DNA-binding CsgD family transcriptional regulator
MRLPAIALDRHGCVVDVNAAAEAVFDNNIKIKDRRLFIRDVDARTLLKDAIDQLKDSPRLGSQTLEPVIVPRTDKLPVIVRIWPFEGPSHSPAQEVRALLTLNALGPRPGPPAAILAKTFCLTPSEAKLACIIARGAPPDIAARELKISRESARNQLKSVFAKTGTHRQSELVALLIQVGSRVRRRLSALDHNQIIVLPFEIGCGAVRGAGAQQPPLNITSICSRFSLGA